MRGGAPAGELAPHPHPHMCRHLCSLQPVGDGRVARDVAAAARGDGPDLHRSCAAAAAACRPSRCNQCGVSQSVSQSVQCIDKCSGWCEVHAPPPHTESEGAEPQPQPAATTTLSSRQARLRRPPPSPAAFHAAAFARRSCPSPSAPPRPLNVLASMQPELFAGVVCLAPMISLEKVARKGLNPYLRRDGARAVCVCVCGGGVAQRTARLYSPPERLLLPCRGGGRGLGSAT